MTAPTTLSFRADKDRETGEQKLDAAGRPVWKVFGPAELLVAGQPATVTKKDGTTTQVLIGKVSKEFEIEGVWCAYGYIAEDEG